MNDTLEAHRKHLAEMRYLNQRQPEDEDRQRRWPYLKAVIIIFDGVHLDPSRPVLTDWMSTPYDKMLTYREDSRQPAGKTIDAGEGFGVVIQGRHGPYKVRSLHRPTLGEVREVNSLEYFLIKQAEANAGTPRWEPVPSDTPLRDRIFPSNFPSCHSKARRLAAKGLRKPADDLSFADILSWFKTKKSHFENFPA